MLEKIYDSHKKWINTTLKFGCTRNEAEDIVGDMYCIIGKMLNNGLDISYGDEVNYYYIYRTLKTSFLQLQNRKKKENLVSLDLVSETEAYSYVDFDTANDKVEDKLDEMEEYKADVFNSVMDGYTIAELSRETGISYHSLYHTYKKAKKELTKEIKE
jgi:DNA-directed RNA polymerase specialized sigma24 family protein